MIQKRNDQPTQSPTVHTKINHIYFGSFNSFQVCLCLPPHLYFVYCYLSDPNSCHGNHGSHSILPRSSAASASPSTCLASNPNGPASTGCPMWRAFTEPWGAVCLERWPPCRWQISPKPPSVGYAHTTWLLVNLFGKRSTASQDDI